MAKGRRRLPKLSQRTLQARARRISRAKERSKKTEWFVDQVSDTVVLTVERRMKLATEFLKNKVVKNISRPVTKSTGPRGGRVVTNRSKPGEYPKADTTQLMRTIFGETKETETNVWDGFVGTPLDYGLILELRMKRPFLQRTLREEKARITKILTGPIK